MNKNAADPFTETFRQAIKDSGLSHSELGRRAGVEPSQISRFVLGKRDLLCDSVGRLMPFLKIRLESSNGKKLDEPVVGNETLELRKMVDESTQALLNKWTATYLNDDERLFLRLISEHRTHKEIARELQCTKPEVDFMLQRILHRLRTTLNKALP
ncbi:MAG: helix-turn-helix transcriptional regulator [Candidatus Peribacteraceae bacterium]|nr:helix-turn-helix transcriptional regulator [Candidatus Peribacteraceae bacterium]